MAPWAADALLILLRWLHALAAVVLLGWTATLVLGPVHSPPGSLVARRFKEVVEVSLLVFLATGAVLTFDRLSRGAGDLYALLLGLKVLCGVAAYQCAFLWRRQGLAPSDRNARFLLILGAIAMLLAVVLKEVFARGSSSAL